MIDDRAVRREILNAGMRGLFTIPQLRDGQVATAPEAPGLYTVWTIADVPPRFARRSSAGHYLGREPTIDVAELQTRWVPNSALLFAGKAANLRTRVRLLVDFAEGKPVAHWDGRALWQLSDADELLVAWATCQDPAEALGQLLARFAEANAGALPFANEPKARRTVKGTP